MSDTRDIVERLLRRTFRPTRDMVQAFEEQGNLTNGDSRLHEEAAAELTRLRAEAEINVEALRQVAIALHEAGYTPKHGQSLAEALRAALSQQAGWQEAVQRLVTGFEHVSGIARQWEPDHSSGADRAKWARATEACADVARLLAAAPQPGAQDG